MRRVFCALTIVCVATAGATAAEAVRRPNIVLILADDLGWGDLSCYPQGTGYPDAAMLTPHIDSLAAQGVKFTQAYSQTMCSPARAALLTGRFPQRFGYYENSCSKVGLPKTERTIAELLRAAGYRTACIGKWHLGHRESYRPMDRGFQRFYGFLGAAHDYFRTDFGTDEDGPSHEGAFVYDQDRPVDSMKYLTDQLTDEAIRFIRTCHDSNEPFFLYLPYNAPHGPSQPRPDKRAEFDRVPNVQNPGRTAVRGLIDGVDEGVGRILRELFLSGLEENTLVVFASDNGGNEFETPAGDLRTATHNGGLRGCKFTTWEGGIRVPLILRWRGRLPKGAIYDRPVSLVDLFPTFAEIADATVPPEPAIDGVDLLPFIDGSRTAAPHEIIHGLNSQDGPQWSIRQGNWKLVSDYPFRTRPPQPLALGLYDLARDAGERTNLLDGNPEKAAELRMLHDEFVARCPPSIRAKGEKASKIPASDEN